MSIIDFKAAQKWRQLPPKMQKQLLQHVFCINCGLATITDYTLRDDTYGIIIEAHCDKCGSEVARVVEME